MLNTRISTTLANTQLNAGNVLFNSGKICIYDGTQPATPETAITNQNLLVTLNFSATAFNPSVNKSAQANSIGVAVASFAGIAAWCRIYASDGVTVLMDGSVDTQNGNIVLNSLQIYAGSTITVSFGKRTLPMQGS